MEALLDADIVTPKPTVILRADHSISRRYVSPNALKVLYRLHNAGFRACLVGGGVRDLLLGREPKDFDIGTDASPEEVRRLFRNCRLIGRRFRLAHVHFGDEIIEVATFRALHDQDDEDSQERHQDDNGLIIRDNVYGSIDEDAQRRDFTINALYYDIENFTVLDYADGMADLQAGIIRLIGDPEQRYREDPVRMLRAVRFAGKLGFRLHPSTEAPIYEMAHLLQDVPPARLFDEVLKLFLGGHAVQNFELLRLYGLSRHLLPLTDRCLRKPKQGFARALLVQALNNTDLRIAAGKPVTPAFLFAALLWGPMAERKQTLQANGLTEMEAIHQAAEEIVARQGHNTTLPRRFTGPMREIWALQTRFTRRTGKRALSFMRHPRFRAAYDFLLLRAEAGETNTEIADWWTRLQTMNEAEQQQIVTVSTSRNSARRRQRPTTRHPAQQTH